MIKGGELMTYAFDTNIIIHYLRHNLNVQQNILNATMDGHDMVIPKMVDYELRRGFSISPSAKNETHYKTLLEQCKIAEVENTTWEHAIQIYTGLYHKRFTVGEMDILIAALCLANDYILVTANTKDFKNIEGLKIVDWTQPQQ